MTTTNDDVTGSLSPSDLVTAVAENQEAQRTEVSLEPDGVLCDDCLDNADEVGADTRCLDCADQHASAICSVRRPTRGCLTSGFGPVKELPETCEGIVVAADGTGGCD